MISVRTQLWPFYLQETILKFNLQPVERFPAKMFTTPPSPIPKWKLNVDIYDLCHIILVYWNTKIRPK